MYGTNLLTFSLTVLIGILVGASAAILIITLVSCFCCSCCLLYKKRNPNGGELRTGFPNPWL